MISRANDAALLNVIGNDPRVRPQLGGEGTLDFTGFLTDPRNVALIGPGGAAFFEWSGPGIYQVHIMFQPGFRGRKALDTVSEMLGWMEAHGARTFWAQPPIINRPVQLFSRLMGFADMGPGHHPMIGPVRYFMLENR